MSVIPRLSISHLCFCSPLLTLISLKPRFAFPYLVPLSQFLYIPFTCIVPSSSPLSHLSVQATGPFLHIGALAAVTALSWIVAGQVARTEKTSMFTSETQNTGCMV